MRLIDADELKENMFEHAPPEIAWGKGDFIDKIDDMPTIDAIPVVRCKDCTYCSHFTDGHLERRLLYNLKPVATTYCQMKENDFCSYGVRKGGQTM